jgi:ribonuclease D
VARRIDADPDGDELMSGVLVDTDTALADLSERLGGSRLVAVDTEFHGEKRYRPELLLLQFADDSGDPVAVDPLSVGSLAPLRGIFEDSGITKVLHSARNDIAILRNVFGCEVRGVFDTQLAAAFLGYGEQISLASLIERLCGERFHGSFSLSDWSMRPLSEEQLTYALDDVRYLIRMHGILSRELESKGRAGWFRDEVSSLSDPGTYADSLVNVFLRARSSGKVRRTGLPMLWALVRWREGVASRLDRPRNSIVRDSLLCRIAVMAPDSVKSLGRLRGLPSGFAPTWGAEIVKVLRKARKSPPGDVPEVRQMSTGHNTSARQDVLRIFLKQKSASMRIAPALLLPRETARSLLADPPASMDDLMSRPDMTQWRKEALGEDLVDLLNGRMAMVMGKGPSGGLEFVRVD